MTDPHPSPDPGHPEPEHPAPAVSTGSLDSTRADGPRGPVDTTRPVGPDDATGPVGSVDTTRPVGLEDTARPVGPVDQEEYRELSDLVTAGLAVLTTRQGRHDVAVTVDSYLDVSYDPPTMLVALYGMSRAAEATEEAGHFCLNVLTEDQQHLADRFGTPATPLIGLLNGIEVTRTADGDAVLPAVLAHFAIRVEQAVDAATHRLLIGPVVQQGAGPSTVGPAVRFAGEKHRLR